MALTPTEFSFNSETDVIRAALFWYGSSSNENMHLAEMRLMRGEKPE